MPDDLSRVLEGLRSGRLSAAELLDESLAAARGQSCEHAFIRHFPVPQRLAAPETPLGGLAVSIKDLFDVAGQPTTAGSRVLADAPPAAADCPAVARLRAAGATLIGHTNLSEFAFSGVGLNPHHGTPVNPVTLALDGQRRIPGGSSSGAAVSVAAGAAWAALGSDTGGSIRIPAALQGLVGFKNTARLTPMDGAIPLARSLDTACAITRSVRDAVLLHEILSGRPVARLNRPLAAWRLAVARPLLQDDLDAGVATAFERSLTALRAAGADIVDIDLPALRDLPPPQARGALVAAEAWAWHHELLARREAGYDPRVAWRIRQGERVTPEILQVALAARQRYIASMEASLQGIDAVLSPTVPVVAPLLQPLVDSDESFFAANALLLRNPGLVNALDGCAISLPCQRPGELPVGLMLWAPALRDEALLNLALLLEPLLPTH
ncbi:amidase [Roseateles saccharophilus]|uniref:Amidase/aspartyl-tRNA(Asn)/glutamyl-tRNA(Gln) amidotransferase subunit A n=1 Tax=Roseateles saccharophilus TaxID=304 RepID=A0A4R3UL47_ROSSA|nr:amidase [Roseateles saccharophilus]MDG0833822.1 amidase [Roseateles saccharophilus]TCU91552.1 amidase/aspartyl-tRNA(Asn)/glutamyl-tRNA(Gln) amidotransferase subunit A [Roseateles saccharophilus]